MFRFKRFTNCFTPLFTYKVLKRESVDFSQHGRFTPLFTYKVLKQHGDIAGRQGALHLYLLTRFSNTEL